MTKYALLVEGNAEQALIDLLLNHDYFKISADDVLYHRSLKVRSADNFAKQYLNTSIPEDIIICRFLDSKKEKFKLKKVYEKKVSERRDYITIPEIEILYIIANGDYESYTNRSKDKPSVYVKKNYGIGKSRQEVEEYWEGQLPQLIQALKKYKEYKKHDKDIQYYIIDLIKDEFKQ